MPKLCSCLKCTPPQKPVITQVWGEDWEGFYVNGELVSQNHSVNISDVLEALEDLGLVKYESIEAEAKDWAHLPETLKEAKMEGIVL